MYLVMQMVAFCHTPVVLCDISILYDYVDTQHLEIIKCDHVCGRDQFRNVINGNAK